jgi:hypothetical protein
LISEENKLKYSFCVMCMACAFMLYLATGDESSLFGQSQIGPVPPVSKLPAVKIMTPSYGDNVKIGNHLSINGISSDNEALNCLVSVIINNVKPYQPVLATGPNGSNDYSRWNYTLSDSYTTLSEGTNKLTSKIECADMNFNSTKWYSVNVTGYTSNTSTPVDKTVLDTDNRTSNSATPSSVNGSGPISGKNILPQRSTEGNNSLTKLSSASVILPDNSSSSPSIGQGSSLDNLSVPVADAGQSQITRPGSTVKLDGGHSSDRDGKIISYSWVQLSGLRSVVLQNANSPEAKFEVPDVKATTNLDFKLIVIDDDSLSSTDTTRIIVNPNPRNDDGPASEDVPCENIGITNSC